MSSDPGLPGLRGLCGRPWPTSITGQSDKTTSHYFLFWVEFIEGSKLIESDTEISTRFRLSDKQRDGSLVSVAGFSPGCLCLCQITLVRNTRRKILGSLESDLAKDMQCLFLFCNTMEFGKYSRSCPTISLLLEWLWFNVIETPRAWAVAEWEAVAALLQLINVVTVQAVSFILKTIDPLPVDTARYQAMIVDRELRCQELELLLESSCCCCWVQLMNAFNVQCSSIVIQNFENNWFLTC